MISGFLNDLIIVFYLCVGSSVLSLIVGLIALFTGNCAPPSHKDEHVDVHVQTQSQEHRP